MIGRLTGFLVECEPTRTLLEVGGVGYSLDIPLSTFYALNGRNEPAVSLFVHTHVREDALQLFGFATKLERAAFEMLVGITGVGPRLALSILSGIGVEELREAVSLKDRQRLQKIPGVGKKTAERLLLELGDRIGALEGDDQVAFDPEKVTESAAEESRRRDALSALMNLGYSRNAASDAIDEALGNMTPETPGLEPLLKEALGRLFR
jgi:Holliday junction DNA helicase RuvA